MEGDRGGQSREEGSGTPPVAVGMNTVTQSHSPQPCTSDPEARPTDGDICNAPTEVCKCVQQFFIA